MELKRKQEEEDRKKREEEEKVIQVWATLKYFIFPYSITLWCRGKICEDDLENENYHILDGTSTYVNFLL